MTLSTLSRRLVVPFGAFAALGLIAPAFASAAGKGPPAGGAAIGQVVAVSVAAAILIGALLFYGLGHRAGRSQLLERASDFAARVGGLPSWAALPAGVATVSLLTAVFGLYWDVSLHIDNGRDPGPLANPAHYFILLGLFGIFSAGWFAVVLPKRRPGPAAITITQDWQAPVGGIVLLACASFALIGFPLDDVWHRLFGQDVTLWGPTHLMMLSGAAMTLIGILVLLTEARLANEPTDAPPLPARIAASPLVKWLLDPVRVRRARIISASGGLLIGLSIYQGEFDFGVHQFRLLFHPVLIAMAASAALVTARILGGRGAALGAAIFFLVVRGALTLLVGTIFGESIAHFPIYLGEAVLVEAAAFAIRPSRPYPFALLAGVLVGTGGIVCEWAWSHAWMPTPWPAHILPAAIGFGVIVGVAGGVVGAFTGSALRAERTRPSSRSWVPALAGVIAIAAVIGYLLNTSVPANARAQVTLAQVAPPPHRTVLATVRFTPASISDRPDWVEEIAWQGHARVVVASLKRVSEGVFRATTPLPVYGSWKSALRLQKGGAMSSVPVYMPADAAIPVPGVAAPPRFERTMTADRRILQRERKHGVPSWLWKTASFTVLALGAILLALLGWALARISSGGSVEERSRREAPSAVGRPVAGAV